jgi:hypothetical protein
MSSLRRIVDDSEAIVQKISENSGVLTLEAEQMLSQVPEIQSNWEQASWMIVEYLEMEIELLAEFQTR